MATDNDPGQRPTIEELIERSSFGTPEAKAFCESAPPEFVRAIVERVRQRLDSEHREQQL
jgi:hypothetical protein